MDRVEFSNPRLRVEIPDYPIGGSKRGLCVFHVERTKRGCRVGRTTTGATKYTTFCQIACIVDGSDGRTYVLAKPIPYHSITIYRHDFKYAEESKIGRKNYVSQDLGTDEQKTDYELLLRMLVDSGASQLPVLGIKNG